MRLIKDIKPELDIIVGLAETPRSALISILYRTQEKLGYLPEDALEEVAEYLQISHADVFEVATFFTLLYKEKVGKNVILVCDTISCYLVGGEHILAALEKETGAKVGGSSSDGLFTIKPVSCLGACDKGPALLLDGEIHGNLTVEGVRKLVDNCRNRSSD